MDSSTCSDEQRQNAGRNFANRLNSLWESPLFRAQQRRMRVAADLSVAVAESQLTRKDVAERAGIKAAQLSRQLSGDVNLTLDSLGRICEAIGYDFDMVLRKAGEQAARQPWERQMDRATLFRRMYEIGHKPPTSKLFRLTPWEHEWQLDHSAANDVPETWMELDAA